MKIPKIELEENKTWKEYIEENEFTFWKMTINALSELSKTEDEECVAFILYGGKLIKPKEFVVQRNNAEETIEKALNKMTEHEEYEYCSKLVDIKNKLNIK
jgi:hypothetical protein